MYNESVDTQELTKRLDEIFSKYVRLIYADWKFDVSCYTCSWRGHWKECDAGHFIRRGVLILRFDPDNVRPQCRDCNRQADGKHSIFEEELRSELGDTRVEAMLAIQRQEAHFDEAWYFDRIIHYEGLVKRLISGDNLRA